jgi:arginine decarboxylase
VSIIQSICDEKNVPHPTIVTESGRSIVAHSSILVFDVIGVNEVAQRELNTEVTDRDSRLVHDLHDIFRDVNSTNLNEFYNDLIERKRDTHNMFSYGVLTLDQLAKAEEIYWATVAKMHRLARTTADAEELFWELEKLQSDTYYCNFSVFQSLPDLWAVGQRFPVMPIHRLAERPDRRATLVDLTCDSDGKIEHFIDTESGKPQDFLEVHD